MAKKVVKKIETWHSNHGGEACGELDALCSDFVQAMDEANASDGFDTTKDTPLTPEFRAAIVALHKFVERQPKPVKAKPRKPKKLKLEVGKSYYDGKDCLVKIISTEVEDPALVEDGFEFCGKRDGGYEYYRPDGSWCLSEDGPSSRYDLVREA